VAEVNFLVKKGLTVPKGSASTPSIIFDASDSNTGIYSPAADELAISTNGTGRLFVDASGNVGVGAAPTNYAGYVNFVNNGSSGATYEQRVAGVLTGSLSTDSQVTLKSVTSIPLVFGTANTERMRLDSSGRLGLGTSTPMNILHVTAANAAGASANDGARVSAGTSLVGINFGADSTATFGWIQSSEAGVAFAPTVINPQGGNVGIGVTSPGDKLEIGGSGSGIILASPDGTRYKLTVANGGTLSIAAA